MKLFLFSKIILHPACRLLMKELDRITVPFQVITADQTLREVLSKMRTDEALLIFLLLNKADLEILNVMRPQIQDRKIITILPDDTEQSRSIGCSVLPRYQALVSDDLSMVAEIAARIIGTHGDSKPIWL